ncbi:LOW QUALITY PROTEIN: DC-STAMP domain-containing protein 2 [Genypterus blacodes]|uniref:LOW QUALITY PROTEIN: DC-STAMP domain-containing protein 2 n=1 Tax=Genypterus blacodes TaxID=154954 RepID=UPI003F75860C
MVTVHPNVSNGPMDLRSSGRCRRVRGHLLEAVWSLLMFALGLLLASLYGAVALFMEGQQLWLCVYTTVGVACLTSFSMGLSAGVRAIVALMLPSTCSVKGKNFLLFLVFSALMSGPLSNTLDNMERAATSLLCGAELAANQTQQLMQRAAAPLLLRVNMDTLTCRGCYFLFVSAAVLEEIKQISSNVNDVVGRVRDFTDTLIDSIRHVARTLRNVRHFMVDIGDVCNEKMGSPYRKCTSLFVEALNDCRDLLPKEINALCNIVTPLRKLCVLARVPELFCLIPSYISSLIKKRLAEPAITAFRRLKEEFDFNISASVSVSVDADSSGSLQEMAQSILEDVSSEVQLLQELNKLLAFLGLVLLCWAFIRALLYRRRYLRDNNFDNIYITAQFEEMDQQLASGGGASVLPIRRREAMTYITPCSLFQTFREKRKVVQGLVSVLRHMVTGALLVAVDFLVYWMLDQVHHQLRGDVIARAPLQLMVEVNGSGYMSDIFRDMLSAFNVLQGGNITVISKKCLLEPSEPNYTTCFMLGCVYGLSLLVCVAGGFIQRCRSLICAAFHPQRQMERIQFLHKKIQVERKTQNRALRSSAAHRRADRPGAATCLSRLRVPGGAFLAGLLNLSSVTCLTCGERVRQGGHNTVTCVVPQCRALYCRPCFQSLGNICTVCMRPLTFQEDSEEELDSSDDEELRLWEAALDSPIITDPHARDLMKRRISTATLRKTSYGEPRRPNTDNKNTKEEGEPLHVGPYYLSNTLYLAPCV